MATKSSLTYTQLLAFTGPALPLAALNSPITVYLPPFYAGEMGLGLALVGSIFMLVRLSDIVMDPILGFVTDTVKTRFGRRRHWLVLSVPILLISVLMVFMPKMMVGPAVSPAYLAGWMFVLYVGFTIATLSQFSWAAELSGDYHGRSQIMGWWEFGRMVGMFTILGVPAFMERMQVHGLASSAGKVSAMGWYFLLLLPITVALAVVGVPELPAPPSVKISLRQAAVTLIKNKLLLRILATDLLMGIPGGLMGALYVFFIIDIIHAANWTSIILLGFFFFGIIGIPISTRLSYALGKHQALSVCMLAMIGVTCGFWFMQAGDVVIFAVFIALSGLAFGGIPVLLRAITADLTDYDNLQSGSARTGLYFALLTMTNKIGFALAVGISYPLLQWLGFVPNGQNSLETLAALRFIFVVFPIIALLIGLGLMYRFPLNRERQQALRRQVEERDAHRLTEETNRAYYAGETGLGGGE